MKLRYGINTITFFVCFIIITACNKFEYSPYQKVAAVDMPRNLNAKNLEKLFAREEYADDTVTVVYSGDSQRFYNELDALVAKVNTLPNIDFFILSGDIADFALLHEYVWVKDRLDVLNVPYLSVIGNHDFTANKGEVFTNVFGEKNFSFHYKGYKFLLHDTNGREYGFNGSVPNLGWLGEQLKDTVPRWFVGVSHIAPYNEDFDRALEQPYKNLLASTPNFIVSLHGHLHGATDSVYYGDGVRYMTSNAVVKHEFVLLKLIKGKIIKQMLSY